MSQPTPDRTSEVLIDQREGIVTRSSSVSDGSSASVGIDEVISNDGYGFILSNGMYARRKPALSVVVRAKQVTSDECVNPSVGLLDLW